ncbi:hypothetical protein JYU34_004721 [Plutella xylostella]|uniref:Major facilitator superfamily (MFS) profile domain-containing protein n=1 Tax=Plutella xylostella TaxID=51655 RepID=A0ABQ7QYU1_PLUXY|nr:hypothetical protein JYU34_004721 [Plutella xylostella]
MGVKAGTVGFEEALNATGFGRFNLAMLLLCGSLVMAMFFETAAVSFLATASACELGTSSVEQGLMAATPMFGIIATSHIWGYFADTKGRRLVLLVSLVLGFTTGLLSALAPNWIVLSGFKLVSASAMSGTFSLANTMLSECTPVAKRNAMIILSTSMCIAANGFMAVLAIPILPLTFSFYISLLDIHFNSWRLLCMIYSLPCALGFLGVYFCFESPKYLLSAGHEDKALEVLKKIYSINKSDSADNYHVKSLVLEEEMKASKAIGLWATLKAQSIPIISPPLLKNTIVISLLFMGIYMCVNPYLMWLPFITDSAMRTIEAGETNLTICQMIRAGQTYAMEQMAGNSGTCVLNQTAMLVILSESLLFTILNSAMSGVINTVGRRRLLIGIQLTSAAAGLCLNYSSQLPLSALLFAVYLSPVLGMGIITSFSVDIYPTHLRAMAVCLTVMVGRASTIVGINILKDLLMRNCELSFNVFSCIILVTACISFLLPLDKRPTKKKSEEIST